MILCLLIHSSVIFFTTPLGQGLKCEIAKSLTIASAVWFFLGGGGLNKLRNVKFCLLAEEQNLKSIHVWSKPLF